MGWTEEEEEVRYVQEVSGHISRRDPVFMFFVNMYFCKTPGGEEENGTFIPLVDFHSCDISPSLS